MELSVDLNADMGEGFGPWTMGDDAGLLDVVTSANIACGMHAGDWDTMAQTMRAAQARGVGIGAHPGFADLQGFGRRRLAMPKDSLRNLIVYQLGAAMGMARSVGAEVRHLKLHGALGNMTSEDEETARVCFEAALSVAPDIIVMVMAGTAQQSATARLGCRAACEIFADRAYNDDATLVDRSLPGAVIHDPKLVASRIIEMLKAGAIIAESGRLLPARIDTVCLHGDSPNALNLARALRSEMEAASIKLSTFVGANV
jgi:UPF0271 protein